MELKRRFDRYLLHVFTPHPRHPIKTIFFYLAGLIWAALLGNFVFSLLLWLEWRFITRLPEAVAEPPLLVLVTCLAAVPVLVLLSWRAKVPPRKGASAPFEAPPPRMKGLILLLSFFKSHGGLSFSEFSTLLNEDLKTPRDWQTLEEAAEKSNFDVPLQAIRYHLKNGTLRDVWLICTDDAQDTQGIIMNEDQTPKSPGSWRLAPFLENFIHDAPHNRLVGDGGSNFSQAPYVRFHYHSVAAPKEQCVVNYFAEQGARDVFRALNYIFDEEVELAGLDPDDVICDITGLRAPHSIGMVMACLPARRRIQYTSSPQTPLDTYFRRPAPNEIRADRVWVERLLLSALGESHSDKAN